MTVAMIINDVTSAILIGAVFYLIKGVRSLSRTARRQSLELDGSRLANEVVTDALLMMEPRLRRVEDLVKNACLHAEMNRQGLERLGKRLADLEPWGQRDQVDEEDLADEAEDDDSTGDDLSDVPIMVVPTMMYPCPNGHMMLSLGYPEGETCPDCGALFTSFPPESPEAVALDKRTGGHSLPVLTSSYSVVCPACETVNKSEGVPPVRCVGCQAELPERQWPF